MPGNHRGNVLEFLRAVRPVTGPTDGDRLARRNFCNRLTVPLPDSPATIPPSLEP
ncbi:MAG TPA: hypothetical protein VKD72_30870 [Gemmataceae bacterium]|nr:hypothetical protein [Gemmataceae bacterium]